jgi:hypothetical protein
MKGDFTVPEEIKKIWRPDDTYIKPSGTGSYYVIQGDRIKSEGSKYYN